MKCIGCCNLMVFAKSISGIQSSVVRSFYNQTRASRRLLKTNSLQKNCFSYLRPANLKNDFKFIFTRNFTCASVFIHQKRKYHYQLNVSIKPDLTGFICTPATSYKKTIRMFCLSSKYLQKIGYNYKRDNSKISALLYVCSLLVFMIGAAYAAVPLYRLFCQATGMGGDPKLGHKIEMVGTMEPIRQRRINVSFNADHHAKMRWNFKPSQNEITVVPGETALAFYTAKNPTNEPIVGIATYNVVPFQAGLYFNKIQCFCFEEQWLNPNEEVDMPVFFYIDPDFDDDPALAGINDIILSYTFFKAEEGEVLPLPGFMKANSVVNLNQHSKDEVQQ